MKEQIETEMPCDFAITHNLVVMSAQFQHKQIHKGKWTSPNDTVNQIDHILINNQKKDLLEDVRTVRGPNIDSDHFLTLLILKQALPAIYRKRNTCQSTGWNKANLQNPIKLEEYRTALHCKLKNLPVNQDVNEEWSKIQTAINEAASNTIQK
jgi:hypothetical protein